MTVRSEFRIEPRATTRGAGRGGARRAWLLPLILSLAVHGTAAGSIALLRADEGPVALPVVVVEVYAEAPARNEADAARPTGQPTPAAQAGSAEEPTNPVEPAPQDSDPSALPEPQPVETEIAVDEAPAEPAPVQPVEVTPMPGEATPAEPAEIEMALAEPVEIKAVEIEPESMQTRPLDRALPEEPAPPVEVAAVVPVDPLPNPDPAPVVPPAHAEPESSLPGWMATEPPTERAPLPPQTPRPRRAVQDVAAADPLEDVTEPPIAPAAVVETALPPKPAPSAIAAAALVDAAQVKLETRPVQPPAPRVQPVPKPVRTPQAPKAEPAGSVAEANKDIPDDRPEDASQPASAPGNAPESAPTHEPTEVAAVNAGYIPPSYGLGSAGNPRPRYPKSARRRGIEGRVVLVVRVGSDGTPSSVKVGTSSGHDSLDRAALEAVENWRFQPATRAGVPVPGTVEVPITFRLLAAR